MIKIVAGYCCRYVVLVDILNAGDDVCNAKKNVFKLRPVASVPRLVGRSVGLSSKKKLEERERI